MDWYLAVLKKYAVFQGRARRREYWMFFLVHTVISVGLLLVDRMMSGGDAGRAGWLAPLYWMFTFLPALAVSVRRLHDVGRSGLWLLAILVPVIGPFVPLVFAAMDGVPGDNEYGPNPKAAFA